MNLLTPELVCVSALLVNTISGIAIATRQLDFNLSRRSGVLINQVVSSWFLNQADGVGVTDVGQELDFDPDNVEIWQASTTPNAVEYDTSRLIRHVEGGSLNSVTDKTWSDLRRSILIKEWHAVPLERRPMSITPMRHHLHADSNVATTPVYGQLMIYYHIVELTLMELGILNASRR